VDAGASVADNGTDSLCSGEGNTLAELASLVSPGVSGSTFAPSDAAGLVESRASDMVDSGVVGVTAAPSARAFTGAAASGWTTSLRPSGEAARLVVTASCLTSSAMACETVDVTSMVAAGAAVDEISSPLVSTVAVAGGAGGAAATGATLASVGSAASNTADVVLVNVVVSGGSDWLLAASMVIAFASLLLQRSPTSRLLEILDPLARPRLVVKRLSPPWGQPLPPTVG